MDYGDCGTLPCLMDTNTHLRKRALALVKIGVSQKVLAGRMGMSPAHFSKWVNHKTTAAVSTVALDGLTAYEKELRDVVGEGEESRRETPASAHAASASAAVPRFRETGPRAETRGPRNRREA